MMDLSLYPEWSEAVCLTRAPATARACGKICPAGPASARPPPPAAGPHATPARASHAQARRGRTRTGFLSKHFELNKAEQNVAAGCGTSFKQLTLVLLVKDEMEIDCLQLVGKVARGRPIKSTA